MSLEMPIPRDTRERNITLTDGQTVLGPFDFPIWDVQDVALYLQEPTWTRFQKMDGDAFTVVPVGPLPGFFTIELPAARPDGTLASIRGLRVPQRLTDVTRDGIIRSVPLEGELDRSAAVQQEIRRDMDRALEANEALDDAVSAAEQARDAAFTYRNEAAGFAEVATDEAGAAFTYRNQAGAFAQTASDKADEAQQAAQLLTTQALPDGTDFDSLDQRGTYVFTSDLNAPAPGTTNRWVLEVINDPADADRVIQRATMLVGGVIVTANRRRLAGGSWEAWATGVGGDGDVTGPNGGVDDGDIPVFAGTTGKMIRGSGVKVSDFASASDLSDIADELSSLANSLGTAATKDAGTSAGNLVQLDASGRLPAVDGSQLTNLPSGNPTAGQVGNATAALAWNAVGSYLVANMQQGAALEPGGVVAGSSLRPIGWGGSGNATSSIIPPGNWMVCGKAPTGSTGTGGVLAITLFRRVS